MSDQQPIGLDTSVVIRLLVGLPENQTKIALEAINAAARKGHTVWVSDLVICETYYALHTHYGVPKDAAVQSLLAFLNSGIFKNDGVAVEALQDTVSSSKKLGLVDRMIHTAYVRKNAKMATFEKAASRLPNVISL